jgi:hypothetical protein
MVVAIRQGDTMKRFVAWALALGVIAGGAGTATAQNFGGLGFGLIGGGAGLGIAGTQSSQAVSTGASFGTTVETTIGISESLDTAKGSLTGSDLVKQPPRLVPEDIPVGHLEEITPSR